MKVFIGIVIGIVTALIGCAAIPLSRFISNMEKGPCDTCNGRTDCFAMKKALFSKDENLSQWMLFSFFRVRGKCDYVSKTKRSYITTYFIANCILVTLAFWSKGAGITGFVCGITTAALLSLAVVDWNTQYIPLEMSGVIFVCGLIQLFADFSNWFEYVIGLIAVSGFLLLVDKVATPILAKKHAGEELDSVIGDGDIKLMAATGLLLGWKLNFLALGIGCVAGSVIHLIRMKIKGSGAVLALGPYLSLGVYITMICGEQLISWYLNMLGVRPY